jgi:hypothetical protein
MKNKKMKPDNNNLDAIAKQARQLPKAELGLGFFKGMLDGKKNQMNALGKIAGGDPIGGASQLTGMKPDQLIGTAMKVAPMMLKKGGSMKNKKC